MSLTRTGRRQCCFDCWAVRGRQGRRKVAADVIPLSPSEGLPILCPGPKTTVVYERRRHRAVGGFWGLREHWPGRCTPYTQDSRRCPRPDYSDAVCASAASRSKSRRINAITKHQMCTNRQMASTCRYVSRLVKLSCVNPQVCLKDDVRRSSQRACSLLQVKLQTPLVSSGTKVWPITCSRRKSDRGRSSAVESTRHIRDGRSWATIPHREEAARSTARRTHDDAPERQASAILTCAPGKRHHKVSLVGPEGGSLHAACMLYAESRDKRAGCGPSQVTPKERRMKMKVATKDGDLKQDAREKEID